MTENRLTSTLHRRDNTSQPWHSPAVPVCSESPIALLHVILESLRQLFLTPSLTTAPLGDTRAAALEMSEIHVATALEMSEVHALNLEVWTSGALEACCRCRDMDEAQRMALWRCAAGVASKEVWSSGDALQALPQKRYGALELLCIVVVGISCFRSSRVFG